MQQEPSTAPTKPKKTDNTGRKKRRRRGGTLNLLLFVGIIGAVALFFWAEQQRRDALSQLQETEQQLEEIKESTERSGQQVADDVLSKLREHIELPEDPQPTVATIIDVDRLRETSDFYNSAENGDHLILTETRAILFDANSNKIIDVVPVVLDPDAAPSEGEEGDTTNSGAEAVDTTQPENTQQGTKTNTNEAVGPDTQALPAGGNVPTTP